MKNFLFISLIFALLSPVIGQVDTLRFMHYNTLKFPEANPNKAFNMLPITRYIKPDIITLNELTGVEAIDLLLTEGLDSAKYSAAPFIADNDLMNGLFYNKHKLGIKSTHYLATMPRRTCVYTLFYKTQDFSVHPDTVFFTIYVVHLKSSQGSANESQRAAQTTAVRVNMNSQPVVVNNLIAGDFNLYKSSETAYQNLLAEGKGQFFDPLNRPGNWNNNPDFKDIHTQSPRTIAFESGVTGGLDDRFDFILATSDIIAGSNGIRYLPQTYKVIGNDGQHYNTSIIAAPTNTSAPDSVIQALYAMSDHLTVVMDVEVNPANAFTGILNATNYSCPELIPGINLFNNELYKSITIVDIMGKVIYEMNGNDPSPSLKPGIYFIKTVNKDSTFCFSKIKVLNQ